MLRKCWWGTLNCTDALEGQTIEPENLFEINESKQTFPMAILGSSVGDFFVLILSFLFFRKSKKEEINPIA